MLTDKQNGQSSGNGKLYTFGLLVIIVAIAWFVFRESLTIKQLAQRELELRAVQQSSPFLIFAVAGGLYVVMAGLALPGAAALSLVYAWFFGFWPALILISFASTLGATLSFLLSRYFLRDTIQSRFGERLGVFNENLDRDGAFYLFSLRLIPAVPFFVINLVMGLTLMRTLTFWWVSQIGMLPGTAVFVYAGSSVPSLDKLAESGVQGVLRFEILLAFVLLGIFPFAVKKTLQYFRSRKLSADRSD